MKSPGTTLFQQALAERHMTRAQRQAKASNKGKKTYARGYHPTKKGPGR